MLSLSQQWTSKPAAASRKGKNVMPEPTSSRRLPGGPIFAHTYGNSHWRLKCASESPGMGKLACHSDRVSARNSAWKASMARMISP